MSVHLDPTGIGGYGIAVAAFRRVFLTAGRNNLVAE
jgi:hypothetical protein